MEMLNAWIPITNFSSRIQMVKIPSNNKSKWESKTVIYDLRRHFALEHIK